MSKHKPFIVDGVDYDEVQGNILKGFNKPHVKLIFFKFGKDVNSTLLWLEEMSRYVVSTSDMLPEEIKKNKQKSSKSVPIGIRPTVLELGNPAKGLGGRHKKVDNYQEVLLHISFSISGIQFLGLTPPFSARVYEGRGKESKPVMVDTHKNDAFSGKVLRCIPEDDPFYQGMENRETILYDHNESSPKFWDEPYRSANIDALFVVAADQEDDLDSFVSQIIAKATPRGISCVGMEIGRTIFNEQGKQVEHFGFRDGISQPLVKGIDEERSNDREYYSDLHSPKDFVLFGLQYRLEWANNGSFLAFRKLEQDVSGFWKFMLDNCKKAGMGPEEVAARLVGRWKSGSSLAQWPDFDPAAPKYSDRNDFRYIPNKDRFLKIRADPNAYITPAFSHIRLANPRDAPGPEAPPNPPEENLDWNNQHRILRRGIPYGPQWASDMEDGEAHRGLLFMCFQRDIEVQFEHIQRQLYKGSNYDEQKKKVVLQSKDRHAVRTAKMMDIFGKEPPYDRISLETWVTTKGGAYFFSPRVSVLKYLREFTSKDEPKNFRRGKISGPV